LFFSWTPTILLPSKRNNLNMIYVLNHHFCLIYFYPIELIFLVMKILIIHIGYNSYQFLILALYYVLKIRRSYCLILYSSRFVFLIKDVLLIIIITFLNHYFTLVNYQTHWYDFLFNPWYIDNQLN
jgi:hypothetical protein